MNLVRCTLCRQVSRQMRQSATHTANTAQPATRQYSSSNAAVPQRQLQKTRDTSYVFLRFSREFNQTPEAVIDRAQYAQSSEVSDRVWCQPQSRTTKEIRSPEALQQRQRYGCPRADCEYPCCVAWNSWKGVCSLTMFYSVKAMLLNIPIASSCCKHTEVTAVL